MKIMELTNQNEHNAQYRVLLHYGVISLNLRNLSNQARRKCLEINKDDTC